MYVEGKKALERGLSRGASILLGAISTLIGVGMILIAPSSGFPLGFYVVGLFCTAMAATCFLTGKARSFFGRLTGAAIFVFCVWYLFSQFTEGPIFSVSRSEPSVLNAVFLLILAGIPGLFYALFGRLSRKNPNAKYRKL